MPRQVRPGMLAPWGRAMVGILIVVLIGSIGFYFLEDMSALDAVYLTVTTISTVGYGDLHPITPVGKVFAVLLIGAGYGLVLYAIALFIELATSGELRDLLGRSRMEREINRLSEHVIVCGYGRIGEIVCGELARSRFDYVVVERRQPALDRAKEAGHLCVLGDATVDDTLQQAGLERASCVVAVSGTDADNVYIALSARQLNAKVRIVARADEPEAEPKLLRAGANRVILPNRTAGMRIALAASQPAVEDFFDIQWGGTTRGLRIEEIRLAPGSRFIGQSLRESDIKHRFGIVVVGIVRGSTGETILSPEGTTKLEEGDLTICLGRPDQFDSFNQELQNQREEEERARSSSRLG